MEEKEIIAAESAEATVETTPAPAEEKAEYKPGQKRVLQGKVVSNAAQKTIIVKFERQIAHPLYKKYYKQSRKFMAHDENDDCNVGDVVRIKECRPLSKNKKWALVDIVERAK